MAFCYRNNREVPVNLFPFSSSSYPSVKKKSYHWTLSPVSSVWAVLSAHLEFLPLSTPKLSHLKSTIFFFLLHLCRLKRTTTKKRRMRKLALLCDPCPSISNQDVITTALSRGKPSDSHGNPAWLPPCLAPKSDCGASTLLPCSTLQGLPGLQHWGLSESDRVVLCLLNAAS